MKFDESIEVDASPAELFRISQDYRHRLDWDPFLKSASLVDAAEAGVGVRAVCVAQSGWSMETEYVSFHPPRAVAVKMTRGPWFLSRFAGSWRFEEIGPGRTRVGFAYSLESRPRALAWLLDPILARSFARDTRARLGALKDVAEHRPVVGLNGGGGGGPIQGDRAEAPAGWSRIRPAGRRPFVGAA